MLPYTISKTVTYLRDAERVECQRKNYQRLFDPPDLSAKNFSRIIQNISVVKAPDFMPQCFEFRETLNSLIKDECQYKLSETEQIITHTSTYLHNTKVFTTNSLYDND